MVHRFLRVFRGPVQATKTFYTQTNQASRGTLALLVTAISTFHQAGAAEAAAGIAYYALFSLFPLLLFLVVVGSFILESDAVQKQILLFVGQAFPTSQELVSKNIERLLELRGRVSIIAAIGLLWSASGVFSVLARNINRAWHAAETINYVKGRLIALAMIGFLMALMVLSLFSSTVFSILLQFNITLRSLGGPPVDEVFLWTLISKSLPIFLTFFMFLGLYRWVPNTQVRWREAAWGALIAAVGWELTKRGFGWYLRSGLGRFELAYGSLGAVVALLLWIYLSSVVILFGAHLSAAIAHHRRPRPKT